MREERALACLEGTCRSSDQDDLARRSMLFISRDEANRSRVPDWEDGGDGNPGEQKVKKFKKIFQKLNLVSVTKGLKIRGLLQAQKKRCRKLVWKPMAAKCGRGKCGCSSN